VSGDSRKTERVGSGELSDSNREEGNRVSFTVCG